MAQLRSLGFGDGDAQDAVAITIAEGGQPSLEAALDWLCVHVPEPSLPARFAAGTVHPRGPVFLQIAPFADMCSATAVYFSCALLLAPEPPALTDCNPCCEYALDYNYL